MPAVKVYNFYLLLDKMELTSSRVEVRDTDTSNLVFSGNLEINQLYRISLNYKIFTFGHTQVTCSFTLLIKTDQYSVDVV